MFTLIKRGIQDTLPLIVVGIVIMLSISFILTMNLQIYSQASANFRLQEHLLDYLGCMGWVIPLLAGLYATLQLYLDTSGKISLFQMSLPVTRTRLYLALIMVGIIVLVIVTVSAWFILTKILEYYKFAIGFSLLPIFGLIFLMALTAYANAMLIVISKTNRGLKCIFYLLCYVSILFFVFYNGLKFQTVAGLIIWSLCALIWSHNKFAIKAIQ